jgi:hypothetical protein
VLRVSLDIDFVKIMSMSPERAAAIMVWNPSRRTVLVPVMPSSMNTPA